MRWFRGLATAVLVVGLLLPQVKAQTADAPDLVSPPRFTLDDLYQRTLKRAEAAKQGRENLYVAELQREKALSVLIPRFSSYGDYRHYSEERYLGELPVQPQWRGGYGVRLDQSFTLNGKELVAYDISKDNIEKERFNLDDIRETLLIQTAAAYYNVLQAEKNIQIAESNVERWRTARDSLKTRVELETATLTDLYRAEAELAKARTLNILEVNQRDLVKAQLASISGLDGPFEVIPPERLDLALPDYALTALKVTALRDRSDLKALEMQREMAEKEIRFTKGAWWPTVAVEGVWDQRDAYPDEAVVVENSLWAGLSLNFTFFDGGLRRAEVHEAMSRERQAQLAIDALHKQISVEVEEAFLYYRAAKTSLDSLREELKFAEENYRAVTTQFDFGLTNSVDVVDANTLLVTAQQRLAEARFVSQLALLQIERATGHLLPRVIDRLALE
jgi:outer membrane protein